MKLSARISIIFLCTFKAVFIQSQISFPTINTNSWMGDVYPGIKDVKVKELKILGTHNSLYLPDGSANLCDQQGESIAIQFLNGARYFDTRIGYDGSFYAFHGDFCAEQNGADISLADLKTALLANPNELIILDIHQSEGDSQIIADMLFNLFGGMHVPPSLTINLTVEEALNVGQLIIIYDTNPSSNPNAFWSQSFVNSDYVSTNNNSDLQDWLAAEIDQLHYSDFPSNQFWVRQCARSFVPFIFESLSSMSDLTNQLFVDSWTDDNLWISKCWNMLKLDWFGYFNHLQKSVERIARWYYSHQTLNSSVALDKGFYTIRSKASGMVLEVENGSSVDQSNVIQAMSNGALHQQWLLEDLGKGKYLVSARHSGKIMEIPKDEMASLSNVEQGQMRPFSNAYWILEEVEPNDYYIRSLSSSRCLEAAGNLVGDNIQLNDVQGTNNQKFSIELVELVTDPPIFGDGTFAIEAKHSGKFLEVVNASDLNGAPIVQMDCNDNDEQQWHFQYFGENQYLIQASHSAKVLDGMASNSNVMQWKKNYNQSQEWLISDLPNGYVSIQSLNTGQYVSVQNAGTMNGDVIVMENWTGGDHQQWKVKDVTTGSCACIANLNLSNTISDGLYEAGISITANGLLQGNSTVFSAGQDVTLSADFMAMPTGQNGYFEIKIEGCN